MIERDALMTYVVEQAADAAIVSTALPAVWPIVRKARLGRFDLAGVTRFDANELRRAIAAAIRQPVRSVMLLSTPDPFLVTTPWYDDDVPFEKSLTVRLNETWSAEVKAGYESHFLEPGWPLFREELRTRLRTVIGEPLGLTFYEEFSGVPESNVGESLLSTLFHYLAATVAGNRKAVEALLPLVRSLTKSIPVGEIVRQDGIWLSAMVPPRSS
jgi:hypothetical protein